MNNSKRLTIITGVFLQNWCIFFESVYICRSLIFNQPLHSLNVAREQNSNGDFLLYLKPSGREHFSFVQLQRDIFLDEVWTNSLKISYKCHDKLHNMVKQQFINKWGEG